MSAPKVIIYAENGGYAWEAVVGDRQLANGWVRGSKSNAREAAARALADLARTAQESRQQGAE